MEASTQRPSTPDDVEVEIDPAVREAVLRRRQARQAREEQAGLEVTDRSPGAAAVAHLSEEGADRTATEDQVRSATEWFLSSDGAADETRKLKINVGSSRNPDRIEWVIRPIDSQTLRRIRKEAQMGTRAQKRAGVAETDDTRVNLGIVVEGTVEPNLLELSGGSRAQAMESCAHAFRKKPGLIAQLSGEIMSLSGYDDEDIQEIDAAGNS